MPDVDSAGGKPELADRMVRLISVKLLITRERGRVGGHGEDDWNYKKQTADHDGDSVRTRRRIDGDGLYADQCASMQSARRAGLRRLQGLWRVQPLRGQVRGVRRLQSVRGQMRCVRRVQSVRGEMRRVRRVQSLRGLWRLRCRRRDDRMRCAAGRL